MENIPAEIKELLKTDGTLKNLRIRFEDGSYPDICNDRIVRESMKFEESLSSREQLKYGLCEDSTLSFECVDFGDIKDKFIRAYIEVDGTSLYDEMQIPALGMPPISQRTSGVLGELYILATFYSPVNGYVIRDKTGLVVTAHIGVGGIWYTVDGIDTVYLEEKCGFTLDKSGDGAAIPVNLYMYAVQSDTFYTLTYAEKYNGSWDKCSLTVASAGMVGFLLRDVYNGACYNVMKDAYYIGKPNDITLAIPEYAGGLTGAIFSYYPIPFGRYKIDECKLDVKKGLRKVKAYTVMPDFYHSSAGNALLTDCFFAPDTTIHFDPMNFFITNNSDKFNMNMTYTDLSPTIETKTVTILGATTYKAVFFITMAAWGGDIGLTGWTNDMVYVGASPAYNIAAETALMDWYNNVKGNFSTAKQEDLLAQINTVLNNKIHMSTAVIGTRDDLDVRKYEADLEPYTINILAHSYIVTHVNVTLYNNNTALNAVDMDIYPANTVTVQTVNKGFAITYDLEVQYERVLYPSGYPTNKYSFYDYLMHVDPRELLESIMELRGWFGGIDRTGRFKPYAIDTWIDGLFPADDMFPADDLYPEDWESESEVNYIDIEDDDAISLEQEPSPIYFGALSCGYLSSDHLDDYGNPLDLVYYDEWDNTGLVYEVTDNEIINQNVYTDAAIMGRMSRLVAALKKLKYYQSNAEIIGLPYMEAGDYAVISLRETSLPVLVLDRKLSGIQAMRDKITA